MNSYTKITLILLLSSLTTLIHTAQTDREKAQQHENSANTASKVAEMSFNFATSSFFFELLYKKLDEKRHVPESWAFARGINKPMMAIAGVVALGASSAWFYHASLAEAYKQEHLKAEAYKQEHLNKEEKSKKWFWQK